MPLIFKVFLDADDIRQAGTMMALDILTAVDVGPEQLKDVMGENMIGGNSVSPVLLKTAELLASAARTYLGQFDEDGADVWELWKKNDEVAAEFLCWHSVARLRLATAGMMESVSPPE
jgi:hypothetical protein